VYLAYLGYCNTSPHTQTFLACALFPDDPEIGFPDLSLSIAVFSVSIAVISHLMLKTGSELGVIWRRLLSIG
jgi:hypothetical protein